MRQICEHRAAQPDWHGIFHWSGDEVFTKYTMALVRAFAHSQSVLTVQAMGEVAGLATAHLSGSRACAPGAPRPYDARLDCSGLERLGIGRRTPFRRALADILPRFAAQ